jgi:hypothetical protein
VRDLRREEPRNGARADAEEGAHVDLGPGEEPGLALERAQQLDQQRASGGGSAEGRADVQEPVTVRRDKWLARMALLMVETVNILDPITRLVMDRVLAVLALIAATGVTAYIVRLTEGWERIAIGVAFIGLCAWLIRKGQR